MSTDGAVRQFRGREFQSLGAATEKRRAAVSKLCGGIDINFYQLLHSQSMGNCCSCSGGFLVLYGNSIPPCTNFWTWSKEEQYSLSVAWPVMGQWGMWSPWSFRMHENFADLTPDGFHFWMTLSPRISDWTRVPRACAPWSKILATQLQPVVNSLSVLFIYLFKITIQGRPATNVLEQKKN